VYTTVKLFVLILKSFCVSTLKNFLVKMFSDSKTVVLSRLHDSAILILFEWTSKKWLLYRAVTKLRKTSTRCSVYLDIHNDSSNRGFLLLCQPFARMQNLPTLSTYVSGQIQPFFTSVSFNTLVVVSCCKIL